ncbi:MAG: hypothetical protein LBI29_01445 [Rickettsiales bacterium]|nr:hypothetical protein [Rickettsiales bacterium]
MSSIFKNEDRVCEINAFIGVDVGKFFVDMYCSFGRKYYTSVSNDRVTLKKTLNKILKAQQFVKPLGLGENTLSFFLFYSRLV